MVNSIRKKYSSSQDIIRILEGNGIKLKFSFYALAKGCMTLVFANDTEVDCWLQSGQVEINGSRADEVNRLLEGTWS